MNKDILIPLGLSRTALRTALKGFFILNFPPMKSKIIYKVYFESGPLRMLIDTYYKKPSAYKRAEKERKTLNGEGKYIVIHCLS